MPKTIDRPLLLAGGAVQRVVVGRVGGRRVAVVRVRIPGLTAHVLVAGEVALLPPEAERGLRAALRAAGTDGAEVQWRTRLEGAHVRSLGSRAATFAREAEGTEWSLRATASGAALTEAGAEPASPWLSEDRAAIEARGREMVAALGREGLEVARAALVRAAAKAVQRVARRVRAVSEDLRRIDETASRAERARMFVAAAARAPRGATRLVAVDWTTGEPTELPLDPARSAQDQLEALFRRAKRAKEGARIANERLDAAEIARTTLEAVAAEARAATTAEELTTLAARAHAAAPRDFARLPPPAGAAGSARLGDATHSPYRAFRGTRDARLLVGKGAADNDTLTFRIARPHDHWLHAKDRVGAHVIVPGKRGATCPPDVLIDAATLAAHFSEARGDAVVDVQHTARRYLRKPRGSAPGLVVVEREKVVAVRIEPERLRRLLDSEE